MPHIFSHRALHVSCLCIMLSLCSLTMPPLSPVLFLSSYLCMSRLCWFPNPAATRHTRFWTFLFLRNMFRRPSLERCSGTPVVSHITPTDAYINATQVIPARHGYRHWDQMYKILYNLVANTFLPILPLHRGCSCLDLQSCPHLKSVAIPRVISNQDLQSRHACAPMCCTGFPSCWPRPSTRQPCIGATDCLDLHSSTRLQQHVQEDDPVRRAFSQSSQ